MERGGGGGVSALSTYKFNILNKFYCHELSTQIMMVKLFSTYPSTRNLGRTTFYRISNSTTAK